MSDTAVVQALPSCDLCPKGMPRVAHYDAKTVMGPWANLCDMHFDTHSVSVILGVPLGTGVGQRLVVRDA